MLVSDSEATDASWHRPISNLALFPDQFMIADFYEAVIRESWINENLSGK